MDNTRTARQATQCMGTERLRKKTMDDQGRIGWTSSNETPRIWTWPGKKQRYWRTTKKNGVDVWPNAAICMWD